MKGKKSAVSLSLSGPRRDMLMVVAFSMFLFLAMNIWMESASVWFASIALVCCIGRTPWRLGRERFCVPMLGLLVFLISYGLAAIYSPFNSAREFSWMLASSAVAALVVLRFEKKHVRGLLWGVAAVCAVISLISIDMACEGPFYEGFLSLMGVFNAREVYSDVTNIAGRVNGIYNDANVIGSLLALGALVSLYLVQTGKKWWERLLACVLVSTLALGLLLSVSRGAILCFGLALLVWLIAVGKVQRLRLFILMVISAGVCLAASVLAMPAVTPGAVLPNALSIIAGGVIFLLDWAVGEKSEKIFDNHRKAVIAVIGSVVVIILICIATAFSVTEPCVLGADDYLYRATSLTAGEYTISTDWEGGEYRQVYIYSRSKAEALMYKATILYNGPVETAVFNVPEDSVRVYFWFRGSEGDVINSARLSDGTELPMTFKFLPRSLGERVQENIFTDNSFLLRIQYMKDAGKLFLQSPLIGHGLGSTDNMYPSVQPFYYASRYVHNHILQIMSDQGMLGTIPFLAFLGGVLWMLIKRLQKGEDVLAAMLLACWVMINSHSLMEISFSLQSYQCVAFILLLLPVTLYSEPAIEKIVKIGGMAVCLVFWLYLVAFGSLLELRQRVRQEYNNLQATSMEQLMGALDGYARHDVFYPAFYQLQYVVTAMQDSQGLYGGQMMQYEKQIRASGDYPSSSALLEYYYLPMGDIRGLFECSQECLLMRKSYANVWNEAIAFYRDIVLPSIEERNIDVFADGILAFQQLMNTVNSDGRMEEVTLAEVNQLFVDYVIDAVNQGLSGKSLYDYLIIGKTE